MTKTMQDSIEFKLGGMTHMSVRMAAKKISECAVDSMIIGPSMDGVLSMVDLCLDYGAPGVRYSPSQRRVLWPRGVVTVAMTADLVLPWARGMNVGAVWLSNLTPEAILGWEHVEMALRLDPMLVIATRGFATDSVVAS